MKLCLSNIAWGAEHDAEMYTFMAQNGFSGLEIAPTRLFGERPYDDLAAASVFCETLQRDYALGVVSMQSLWFKRAERLFGDASERQALLDYTARSVDLARALGCYNLVLGSPKNRVIGDAPREIAIDFLRAAADYAAVNGCTIAFEPNPADYGTDFVNSTPEALALARGVARNGCSVNLDFGTIIMNGESLLLAKDDVALISHVHISEPFLAPIERRAAHGELRALLEQNGYDGHVSVEMKNTGEIVDIKRAALYLKEVFA